MKSKMIRSSILILFLSFGTLSNAQSSKINWMTFDEAVSAQAKNPKKIMVDMYTVWCGPCKLLDKNTFSNKDLIQYVNEHYYAVKFNAEGNSSLTFKDKLFSNPGYDPSRKGRNSQHELASYFGITAYPTILFLDEQAAYIAPIRGYHNPNQLELFLKLFASDSYKTVNTPELWTKYQQEFKPKFKI